MAGVAGEGKSGRALSGRLGWSLPIIGHMELREEALVERRRGARHTPMRWAKLYWWQTDTFFSSPPTGIGDVTLPADADQSGECNRTSSESTTTIFRRWTK